MHSKNANVSCVQAAAVELRFAEHKFSWRKKRETEKLTTTDPKTSE